MTTIDIRWTPCASLDELAVRVIYDFLVAIQRGENLARLHSFLFFTAGTLNNPKFKRFTLIHYATLLLSFEVHCDNFIVH